MKKIINSTFVMLLVLIATMLLAPRVMAAEQQEVVEVDVVLNVFASSENTLLDLLDGAPLELGEVINISSLPAGEMFVFDFWIVNGVVRYDLDANAEFLVHDGLTLTAVYHPADNSEHFYAFIDSNGKFIDGANSYGYVDHEESVVAIAEILDDDLPSKPGYLAQGFIEVVGSMESVTQASVFQVDYQKVDEGTFTASATNGVVSNANPAYNDIVTVTFDGEGEFAYWTENGAIVSYSPSFTYSALGNREFVAVEDTGVPARPVVSLQILSGDDAIREDYSSYLGKIELNGAELIEFGLLLSNDPQDLYYGSATLLKSTVLHPTTNEFLRSIADIEGEMAYDFARAYIMVKEGNSIKTYYSAHESMALNQAPSSSELFKFAESGAFELNRWPGTLDLRHPDIDFLRTYIFVGNQGTPNIEDAVGYFDTYVRIDNLDAPNVIDRYTFYTIVNDQQINFIDIYGINNVYLEPVDSVNMIKAVLGENYSMHDRYYLANKVFVNDNQTQYNAHSTISGYSYWSIQELVEVPQTAAPAITADYVKPNGNGNVTILFNRGTQGTHPNLTEAYYLEYALIRVYDSPEAVTPVGGFRILPNKQLWSFDGTTYLNVIIEGPVNNLYINVFKPAITAALGEVYDKNAMYYFTTQLFVTDNFFTEDSIESAKSTNYWQEEPVLEQQEKPGISNQYFFPEGSGVNTAIAMDRIADYPDLISLTNSNVQYLLVYIFDDAAGTNEVGRLRIMPNKQTWSGDGSTNYNVGINGDAKNLYVFNTGAEEMISAALGENYSPTTRYYFRSQLIVIPDGAFLNDSDISDVSSQGWIKTA